MTLTINLCTRERPTLLLDTVERTLPNIKRDDTLLMISADKDDADTVAALSSLPADPRILPVVLDREDSMGEKVDRAMVFGPADVYAFMTDYAPHLTPGFDQKILDAVGTFPDGIGVVYGPWANMSFPSLNAVTAKLAHKMGYIYPPWFPFWFTDHWLDDIARYIDRIAWVDIKLDTRRRPGRTGSTIGRRDVKFWTLLFDALYLERQRVARRIIESPEFSDPPWRKHLALSNFFAVHERSRLVNMQVRESADANDKYDVPLPPAEAVRYERIKAKATGLLRDLIPQLEAAQREG